MKKKRNLNTAARDGLGRLLYVSDVSCPVAPIKSEGPTVGSSMLPDGVLVVGVH